jgi:hypothetical protein
MYKVIKDAQDELKLPNCSLLAEYHKHYKTGLSTAFCKLEKYFQLTDQSIFYRAAIILH